MPRGAKAPLQPPSPISDRLLAAVILVVLAVASATAAEAVPAATRAALAERDRWCEGRFPAAAGGLPFSFTYDGKPAAELLAAWPRQAATKTLDAVRRQTTWTWRDPASKLEVQAVAVTYADFPAVEWTLSLRNAGTAATPLIEAIQGIDAGFSRGGAGEFTLHHNRGDTCGPDSYQPLTTVLAAGSVQRFAPNGGRPTDSAFPYFSLQRPGGGIFLAFGWPGRWTASFSRDDRDGVQVVAGQDLTRMSLKPGETVRAPLIALLFWQGDDLAQAQNLWRRWMLVHNTPSPGGKPWAPQMQACSSFQYAEMTKADEASQLMFIDGYAAKGIKLDYWWMDAGWYPCGGTWQNTGTWEPDLRASPRACARSPIMPTARG